MAARGADPNASTEPELPAVAAPSGARLRAAPAEEGERTMVSARRSQELEDRRTALRRVMLLGLFAFPGFAIADVLGAYAFDRWSPLPFVLAVRGVGVAVLLVAWLGVRKPKLSARAIGAMDAFLFVFGGLLVSLQAIPMGGLASRFILGVLTIAWVRTALVPSHWSRALAVGGGTAVTFPLTMLAASFFRPEIAAQWRSGATVASFAYDFVVLLAGVGLGAAGAHLGWAARRQVHEARKLGSYRLKARIGSGGNGDVWLARQEPLGRDVALKVLRERGRDDEESVRRFVREARAASALKHPNTIRIYEFGASDDGVLFIAMELLDGLDLDTLVDLYGPMPPARVVHFARQACGSLAEAHEHHIVHRDIKPANFFVTRAGDDPDFLKLLDFGVARVAALGAKSSSLTDTGIMFGTPAYMSPEVCGGERADARSDVYSLGAVLYFMLTATALFPGRSFSETVMSHVSRTPEPPSVRVGERLPDSLETIVMRCLEKKPEDRFATVRELDAALAKCEAELGRWTKDSAKGFWSQVRASVQLRVRPGA